MSAMFSARTLTTRAATLAATAALPLTLAACASGGDNGDSTRSSTPVTTSSSTPETSEETTSATPSTSTSSSSTSTTRSSAHTTTSSTDANAAGDAGNRPAQSSAATSSTSASQARGEMPESVANAYEIFGELVPRSLFEQFDSCESVGMQSYYNCSGTSVGQFQFTESTSKAVSTLQTLTELRTSQVVDDSGDRVVGWSSLGSTAIITVVNTESGLVMQHMISGDADEPEEKIKELGLVS